MRSKSCPDVGRYQRLAAGSLPGAEKQALLDHLKSCAECTQKLNALPEKDTLAGLVRQAPTLDAKAVREAMARPVKRITEARHSAKDSDGGASTVAYRPVAKPESELADFLAPPQTADELGRLGPYRVLQVLGAGGMGIVFRAEDPQLARLVALKVIRPALAASPSAHQRFLREARAVAAIKHDHIVSVYQVGEDRGLPFLAMEFLDGEPLDARLERMGKLPLADVLRIGQQIALGLAAAHMR